MIFFINVLVSFSGSLGISAKVKKDFRNILLTCRRNLVNMDEKLTNIQDIDVNSPEFYDKVQAEIEFDTARMKKNVEVLMNLRLEAAEIEVETAALFHAEIWYDMLDKPEDDNDDDDFSDGGGDESGEDQDMEEDASTTPIEEETN